MGKQKYYVVWKGLETGVFESWALCLAQVKGYPGALYKSFNTLQEAEEALVSGPSAAFRSKSKTPKPLIPQSGQAEIPVWDSWAVDAACSGNPGPMEYRGVETRTGKELFRVGPFPLGTNNIGEFLAIVHALALLKNQGSDLPVYTDSRTARKWLKDNAVKTKLPRDKRTEDLHRLIDRALLWLKENRYKTTVLTWDTETWGEIPADFGRK